jgi:hypothetical protein
MSTFDFVNEETGIPFRLRIVRRGEPYGEDARHNRDEPLIEFYYRDGIADLSRNGERVAVYYADQFLRPSTEGVDLDRAVPTMKLTAKNCEQIAAWLRIEMAKPWMPPPPLPRPLPDSPIEPIAAADRKVTIFLGTRKYEATWLEVSRARHAQYEHAYHVKFKPKKARYPRKFVDYRGRTVIVDGWGHPEFDPLRLLGKGEATTVTVSTGSASDPHKLKLAGYLASLPISQILLDTRGVVVEEIRWHRGRD